MSGSPISGPARMQLRALEITGRVQPGTEGRVAGHAVQQGGGGGAPTRNTGIGQEIKAFFKMVGKELTALKDRVEEAHQSRKEARAEAKAARAEAKAARAAEKAELAAARAFEADRAALLKVLPEGVTVSDTGVISGGFEIHTMPASPLNVGREGLSFVEALTADANHALRNTLDVGGTILCSQAKGDLGRNDITIRGGDRTFRTSPDAKEKDNVKGCVDHLNSLTGSKAATTVVSSVVSQLFGPILTKSWKNEDGTAAHFQIKQSNTLQFPYRTPDNEIEMLNPSGMGGAKIDVSKNEEGNIAIRIDWTAYYQESGTSAQSNKTMLPGMDGAMLKARYQVEYTVDLEAAKSGRLVIEGLPPSVTFEGRMAT